MNIVTKIIPFIALIFLVNSCQQEDIFEIPNSLGNEENAFLSTRALGESTKFRAQKNLIKHGSKCNFPIFCTPGLPGKRENCLKCRIFVISGSTFTPPDHVRKNFGSRSGNSALPGPPAGASKCSLFIFATPLR